jgi:hypothetical protein
LSGDKAGKQALSITLSDSKASKQIIFIDHLKMLKLKNEKVLKSMFTELARDLQICGSFPFLLFP